MIKSIANNYNKPLNPSFTARSSLAQYAAHCAYCGKDMIQRPELEAKVDELMVNGFNSGFAQKYINILPEVESNALKLLAKTAKANPNLNSEEVFAVVYADAKKFDSNFNRRLFYHNVGQSDVKFVQNHSELIKKLCNASITTEEELCLQKKLYSKMPDSDLKKELMAAITVNYILAKSSGGAKFCTSKFLGTIVSSIEHLQAFSKNGINDITNYLYAHVFCNAQRENTRFGVFLTKNPLIRDNIENQVLEIHQAAPQEEITAQLNGLCDNLRALSNNRINIVF